MFSRKAYQPNEKRTGFDMKFTKIIAAAAASVMAISAVAFSAFAANDATFCFDTDESVSMLRSYGSIEETGFKASIDEQTKFDGNGSLKFSQKVKASVPEENRSGGLYFTASSLGLDSFAGCTISMKVLFDKEAAKLASSFNVFSDGIVWLSSGVSADNAGEWTDVSITLPSNADNTSFGFSIPVFEAYDGAVAYIDDLTVITPTGTAIENIGDQKESTGIIVSVTKGSRILLIILVCVILVGVVVCVGLIISKFQNRFTE